MQRRDDNDTPGKSLTKEQTGEAGKRQYTQQHFGRKAAGL